MEIAFVILMIVEAGALVFLVTDFIRATREAKKREKNETGEC